MTSPWYRATADAATIPAEVAQRAVEWLMVLQSEEVTEELRQAWAAWRAAHPDHERAWQRIESVRGRLQPLSAPGNADLARAALAPTPARSARRRRLLGGLGVATLAGALAWQVRGSHGWRQWMADHRTAVGQRRTLVLSDGSRLWMNTDSAVTLQFDERARRVVLLAGEIAIATAREDRPASRPFLVQTDQGEALALGTRFSVRQQAGQTTVSVLEGAVQIQPRLQTAAARVVQAGYRARCTADAVATPVAVEPDALGWTDGIIVARSMRLDAFLAELGRYSRHRLSCDPGAAGLLVSGSFPLDDIDKVLDTLATTLALHKQVRASGWGAAEIRLSATRPVR